MMKANNFGRSDPNCREEFRAALLARLPDSDFRTYNDYDPSEGPLLAAMRTVTECRGFFFSGDGLLPTKAGIRRRGNQLLACEGRGCGWHPYPPGAGKEGA